MAFLSDLTNEIYDNGNAAFVNEGGDTTKVFLGVLVTLLPKVTLLFLHYFLVKLCMGRIKVRSLHMHSLC